MKPDLPRRHTGAGLDETLAEFRNAVRAWSGEQLNAPRSIQYRSRPPLTYWTWAGVAIAMLLIVWISLAARGTSVRGVKAGESDTALLDRIDRELSRSVPGPMEPLTKLVSWDKGGQ